MAKERLVSEEKGSRTRISQEVRGKVTPGGNQMLGSEGRGK